MRALLIQKSIKQKLDGYNNAKVFESFVNSEEYQTTFILFFSVSWFESFVNSEEYQTTAIGGVAAASFESFVNSEEYQTIQQI